MTLLHGARRRLARTYHLWCARDDVRRHGLVLPAGVWMCRHCPQVSFDTSLLRQHVLTQH